MKQNKKRKKNSLSKTLVRIGRNPKVSRVLAVALGLVALSVLAWIIIGMPNRNAGTRTGVGADGSSYYEIKGADLGIADVVSKAVVEKELASVAGRIGNVNKSGVVSLNGNQGQTATFYFENKSGAISNFYVDVLIYKSKAAYESDQVFAGTGDAGKVGDYPARYMKAKTIANDREYALLVTKNLKSYRFAIAQPRDKVAMDEVTAQSILKKIAEKANL